MRQGSPSGDGGLRSGSLAQRRERGSYRRHRPEVCGVAAGEQARAGAARRGAVRRGGVGFYQAPWGRAATRAAAGTERDRLAAAGCVRAEGPGAVPLCPVLPAAALPALQRRRLSEVSRAARWGAEVGGGAEHSRGAREGGGGRRAAGGPGDSEGLVFRGKAALWGAEEPLPPLARLPPARGTERPLLLGDRSVSSPAPALSRARRRLHPSSGPRQEALVGSCTRLGWLSGTGRERGFSGRVGKEVSECGQLAATIQATSGPSHTRPTRPHTSLRRRGGVRAQSPCLASAGLGLPQPKPRPWAPQLSSAVTLGDLQHLFETLWRFDGRQADRTDRSW